MQKSRSVCKLLYPNIMQVRIKGTFYSVIIMAIKSYLQSSRIPPPTPRNLWIFLAGLVATQNIAVFHTSQTAGTTIFALLIWGGAVICMEDQFEALTPQPRLPELIAGTVLLLLVVARSASILSSDGAIFALAPLVGIALGLICYPLPKLIYLRDPFLCLMLLPSYSLLMRLMPEKPISLLTAQGAALWLGSLGLDVLVDGRNVYLRGGGVEVLGACNGLDMMAQIFCICVIFMLAFPLRSALSKILLLVSAPIIGVFFNTFRIALLAFIVSGGDGKGSQLFEFFHQEGGSLVFSGLGVLVFGYLYMRLLDRELPPVI